MIQVQLAEVFRNVVYNDYPEKCPGMLEGIYNNLIAQVCTLCICMRLYLTCQGSIYLLLLFWFVHNYLLPSCINHSALILHLR